MSESKSLQILVIDDDPVINKMLEKRLGEHGYTVDVSSEAPVGLQKAMNDGPDLIILDVMMPVINGYNVCRLLKTEEATGHIPIILLTSRDAQEDVAIGLDMGADAYLIKPVDIEELFRTIDLVTAQNSQ